MSVKMSFLLSFLLTYLCFIYLFVSVRLMLFRMLLCTDFEMQLVMV